MPPVAAAAPTFAYRWYLPFTTKAERGDDGCLYIRDVVGTSEALDRDGEVVDYASAKAAMTEYMSHAMNAASKGTGPLREMHVAKCAGRVISWRGDDKAKKIYLTLKVIAPDAIKLVEEGGYTGVSIGFRRSAKKGNRLFVSRIGEYSLVDAEANPDSFLPLEEMSEDAFVTDAKLWTDRQGLEIVQAAVAQLSNLLFVREAVHAHEGIEGDAESPLPEQADALVEQTAEFTRILFLHELDEALENMDAEQVTAGRKLFDDFLQTVKGHQTAKAKTALVLATTAESMKASFNSAAQRLHKETPMDPKELAEAKRAKGEALTIEEMKLLGLEYAVAKGADGEDGMSAEHKRHAKAFVAYHEKMADHHEKMAGHLATHKEAMHASVHKDFMDAHREAAAHHKEAAAHVKECAKMLGHKKGGEPEPVETTKSVADQVAEAVAAALPAAVEKATAPLKAELDTTKAKLKEVEDSPAARVLPANSGPAAETKAVMTPELDKKITDTAMADPQFGADIARGIFAHAFAARAARRTNTAAAAAGGK